MTSLPDEEIKTWREVILAVFIGVARRLGLKARTMSLIGSYANSKYGNALVAALLRGLLPNPIRMGNCLIHWDRCHHAILVFIRNGGMVEPETLRLIRSLSQPNTVFADVGASIGWHSLTAAIHGALVYAFEPHPHLYRTLSRNIAANNLENRITPIRKAVGDHNGRDLFHLHPTNAGSSGFFSSGPPIEVETVTLDSAVPHADLVKLDVEGAEVRVLAGMHELVKRSRPTLICELSPECLWAAGYRVEDLYEALFDVGYRSVSVVEDGNGNEYRHRQDFLILERRYRHGYCNLVCRVS